MVVSLVIETKRRLESVFPTWNLPINYCNTQYG